MGRQFTVRTKLLQANIKRRCWSFAFLASAFFAAIPQPALALQDEWSSGSMLPATLKPNEAAALELLQKSTRAPNVSESSALLRQALGLVPEPSPVRGHLACSLTSRLQDEWAENKSSISPELSALADECYRLLPSQPAVQFLVGFIKIASGKEIKQGGRLMIASINAQPILAKQYDIPGIEWLFRRIQYAGDQETLNALKHSLVQAGFGKDNPSFFSSLAIEAMEAQMAQNKQGDAIELLPQIFDTEVGLRLLIDRRFEPIWPTIEQWAGNDLTLQRDARVNLTRANFNLHGSLENRRFLSDALWQAGQRREAIALLAEVINTPALWDEDRYFISFITVRYARMLAQLGRVAEGIEVATRVNRANPIEKYPYAANLMPNLASFLIAQGYSQQALDLIAREIPTEGGVEEPAAMGFYTALRYCALRRLGKKKEAEEQSALLDVRFSTNNAAIGIRNGCSVDRSSARTFWIARFTNQTGRSEHLLAFYRLRRRTTSIDSTFHLDPSEMMVNDPEVLASFAKFGRDLPASYLPAVNMWGGTKESENSLIRKPRR